LTLRKK